MTCGSGAGHGDAVPGDGVGPVRSDPLRQGGHREQARAALDLLTNPDKIKKAKDELASRLRGREYVRDPSREPPLEKARELAEAFKGNVD